MIGTKIASTSMLGGALIAAALAVSSPASASENLLTVDTTVSSEYQNGGAVTSAHADPSVTGVQSMSGKCVNTKRGKICRSR